MVMIVVCGDIITDSDGDDSGLWCVLMKTTTKAKCVSCINPRSGERPCDSAYACRDGEVLVVTKNKTLPFSRACPNPVKNGPKPLAKLYNSPKN